MSQLSYFAVFVRYPRRIVGGTVYPATVEAVVNADQSRDEIIRLIVNGDYPADDIAWIHHIDGNSVQDVTEEIINAAEFDKDVEVISATIENRQIDYLRDLRKHGEVA